MSSGVAFFLFFCSAMSACLVTPAIHTVLVTHTIYASYASTTTLVTHTYHATWSHVIEMGLL